MHQKFTATISFREIDFVEVHASNMVLHRKGIQARMQNRLHYHSSC